jgi:hypothetical protein
MGPRNLAEGHSGVAWWIRQRGRASRGNLPSEGRHGRIGAARQPGLSSSNHLASLGLGEAFPHSGEGDPSGDGDDDLVSPGASPGRPQPRTAPGALRCCADKLRLLAAPSQDHSMSPATRATSPGAFHDGIRCGLVLSAVNTVNGHHKERRCHLQRELELPASRSVQPMGEDWCPAACTAHAILRSCPWS